MPNTLNRLQERRSDEAGFTLIELLITIVILGVLAGIVVFAVSGINDESVEVACKADKKNVEVAAEAHRAQEGVYADNIAELVTDGFLRDEPDNDGYTITYVKSGDSVAIGPASCG